MLLLKNNMYTKIKKRCNYQIFAKIEFYRLHGLQADMNNLDITNERKSSSKKPFKQIIIRF